MSYDDKRKFTVHISDEDYEAQSLDPRARGTQEMRPRRPQQGPAPVRRPAQPPQGAMQRRDVPVSRTRVVTTREGDKYEIPDDSALSLSFMKKHRKNRKGRGCLIAVVYALLVCSISALLSFYLIVGINDMFGLVKEDAEIVVEIPENATLGQVTDILADNGVVNYPFFFKLYAQISNDDAFQSGTFTLNSKSDYSRLITKLTLSANAVDGVIRVTIPEGYSVDQIAQLFEDNCVCTKEAFYQTLQEYPFKHEFMPLVKVNEQEKYRLEGYLYPGRLKMGPQPNAQCIPGKRHGQRPARHRGRGTEPWRLG